MFLTTRGRYAVTAMMDIILSNKTNGGKPVNIAEIAKRHNVSTSYLEQLFLRLKRGGFVLSVRGPGGGYKIAKDISEISLYDILECVGEEIKVTNCKSHNTSCTNLPGRCITHSVWSHIGKEIRGYFSSISMKDVVDGTFKSSSIINNSFLQEVRS